MYPSYLLNIFLSLSLLFDAVRVRSLWLASDTAIAEIYTASITVKVIWFYLESRSKRGSFLNPRVQYGDEEVHALYSRTFFWWLNPYLFLGFKHILSVDDLPHLDQALSENVLHRLLVTLWTQGTLFSKLGRPMLVISHLTGATASKNLAQCSRLLHHLHFQVLGLLCIYIQASSHWVQLFAAIPYYGFDQLCPGK